MKTEAVILGGGRGKRMGSDVPKQYMELKGFPLISYSIRAFEESFVDSIILVCSAGDEEYCKREIVDKYGFKKVRRIVSGGAERYHSVLNGLKAAEAEYVFIHDGARIFVNEDILKRLYDSVRECGACVAAMPVKDTIKLADEGGYVEYTPARERLWQVQTPQVFETKLIRDAYLKLEQREKDLQKAGVKITDDAMVLEYFSDRKIRLVPGSYENIKITTPEDMAVARAYLDSEAGRIIGRKDEHRVVINTEDVLYFESVDDKTFAYTKSDVIRVDNSLQGILEQIDDIRFFRCSRSMIINVSKVRVLKSLSSNRIDATLENGEHILISRTYASDFRKLLKGGIRRG